MPEEILIVATEASADLHAARVLEELRRLRPGLGAFGVGGPRLRAAGLEALYGAEELSVMGFAEVLPRIPRILAILRGLREAAGAGLGAVWLQDGSFDDAVLEFAATAPFKTVHHACVMVLMALVPVPHRLRSLLIRRRCRRSR